MVALAFLDRVMLGATRLAHGLHQEAGVGAAAVHLQLAQRLYWAVRLVTVGMVLHPVLRAAA
jgi:hypothetical protein